MNSPIESAARPEFSIRSIVRALWKQKFWIVGAWFLITVITIGVVHQLPAIYQAETLILVDSQKIPERYVTSTVNTDVQDRLATLNQQILSSSRLKPIIDDFGLYKEEQKTHVQEEIIEMMRKDIGIKLEKGWTNNRPGAFRIGYQGRNPSTVSEVTNRIANLYIDENLKNREIQAEGTSDFINSQLKEAKRTLDDLEAKVSRYKLTHTGELPEQEGALVATLTRLQAQLQGNQDALSRAQQNKILIENGLSDAESTESVLARAINRSRTEPRASAGPDSAVAVVRQSQSEALEERLNLLRLRYNEDHPDIRRLKDEQAALKKTEEAKKSKQPAAPPASATQEQTTERGSAAPRFSEDSLAADIRELGRVREKMASLRAQIKLVNFEMEKASADQQKIRQAIADYQRRVEKLPVREQEMASLTRDYEISKANYRSLLDKKFSAEMSADLERRQKAERFTILDPARTPEKPSKPNRPLFYALGSILGIGLGMVIGYGREFKANTFLGEWELPSQIPVLGSVPYIRIAVNREPQSGALSRPWRLALLSTGLLSLLAVIVLGAYLAWNRL